MSHRRKISAEYLAGLCGLNPKLVRRYAKELRKMLESERGGDPSGRDDSERRQKRLCKEGEVVG